MELYFEVHGSGSPVVLLHGALSTIETSFGRMLPGLAEGRQVIAVEQQAHGHTPDVDRPLTYRQMARDTAAVLRKLNVEAADVVGYSMGAGIAAEMAIRHPGLVRRLVVISLAYSRDGIHPEIIERIETTSPADLAGSVFEAAYTRTAPHPEHWPVLIAKCNQLDREFQGWPIEDIKRIRAPALIIVGDADIVRPEHAVQLLRLLGGGTEGDSAGLRSELAVLPGTTHLRIVERAEWLLCMIGAFLDRPVAGAE